MPLDRAHMTRASWIMLRAYTLHAIFFGVLYIADPGGRLDRAPGLAFARLMMPLALWGMLLLLVAAFLTGAILTGSRALGIAVLWCYASTNVLWAAIYAAAPFVSPDATFGGPGHPLLIATACVASAVSLQRREA